MAEGLKEMKTLTLFNSGDFEIVDAKARADIDTANGKITDLEESSGSIQGSINSLNDFASQLSSANEKFIIDYQTVSDGAIKSSGRVPILNNTEDNILEGYIRTYGTTSIFSGWAAYIGKPTEIDTVMVPGKLAASENEKKGEDPTAIRITIREVPNFENFGENWNDMTGWDSKYGPAKWPLLFDKTYKLSELGTKLTDEWEWVKVKLGTKVSNPEKKMLWLSYSYDAICSAMFLEVTSLKSSDNSSGGAEANKSKYPMGYNLTSAYSTATGTANGSPSECQTKLTTDADTYMNTKSFNILPIIIGHTEISEVSYDIDTSANGKFTTLVKRSIDSLNSEVETVPEAEIRLAKSYDLVVGDTFQLFFRSVIKCYGDYHRFGINCVCPKGDFYPDYYEYTPTAEDDSSYTLKITLRDFNGKVLSEQTTVLHIHKVPTFDVATTKNMLVFGDSLTGSGTWAAEGLRRIVGTSDSGFSGPNSLKLPNLTINTYGRNTNTVNTFKIKHEGYGGWTWQSFIDNSRQNSSTINGLTVTTTEAHNYEIDTVQKSIWTDNNGLKWELEDLPSNNKIKFNRGSGNNGASSSITIPTSMTCSSPSLSINVASAEWEPGNPFYNPETEKIDFKYWAEDNSCPSIDIAACLLTWNGGGGNSNNSGFTYNSAIAEHIKDAKVLLDQFHSDYPDAKIILMGIQISSLTGGTGTNYHATGGYADMRGTAFYAWDYNKALEELCLSSPYNEFCYYVDTKGQFDTIHNMPSVETKVNTRSTKTYLKGTNGVHPSTEGYYQIGDAYIKKMIAILGEQMKVD